MSIMRARRALLPAGILAASLAGFAGDETPPRFEFYVGGGPSLAGGASTYRNAFDPHPGYKIPGSYARQTLTVDPAPGGYLVAGGTFYFRPRFGLRLAFHSDSRAVGGKNTPYDYLYLYTSTTPPDYIPIDTSHARQIDWPSSEGRIKEWGGRLELVWRRTVSPSLEIALAGGFTLASAGGRLHPLGFTDQWQGGHGVLFVEDYLVYLRLPPRTLVGAILSVETTVRLSGRVWLRFEAAFQRSGAYEAVPEIDKVLSYYSLDEAGEEISRLVGSRFNLQPLRVSLSRASIGAGFAVRL